MVTEVVNKTIIPLIPDKLYKVWDEGKTIAAGLTNKSDRSSEIIKNLDRQFSKQKLAKNMADIGKAEHLKLWDCRPLA